jgi:hypothetical protein
MNQLELSRQDIYNLVWEKPLSHLAKEYKISYSGLRKICVRLKIPLPNHGHWARLRLGKSYKKPALPEYNSTEKIQLEKRNSSDQVVPEKTHKLNQIVAEVTTQFKTLLSDKDFEGDRHPLIKSLEKDLIHRKGDSYGRFQGMWVSSSSELTVRFSRARQQTAIRFLKKLLHTLDQRGHKITVEGWSHTYLIIGQIKLEIALKERMKMIKEKQGSWDYNRNVPTGILYFQYDGWSKKEWTDEKEILDVQIPKIIAYLEVKAHELNIERIEREERFRIQEANERKHKELLELKKGEFLKFVKLMERANQWKQAQILREFISSNREKDNSLDASWVSWAMEKANWLDPTTDYKDELMGSYPPDFLKEPIKFW